jgi:hypothetical protein
MYNSAKAKDLCAIRKAYRHSLSTKLKISGNRFNRRSRHQYQKSIQNRYNKLILIPTLEEDTETLNLIETLYEY